MEELQIDTGIATDAYLDFGPNKGNKFGAVNASKPNGFGFIVDRNNHFLIYKLFDILPIKKSTMFVSIYLHLGSLLVSFSKSRRRSMTGCDQPKHYEKVTDKEKRKYPWNSCLGN